MEALRLLFEGWLALSTIGLVVCACLPDGREKSTQPAAKQDNTAGVYTMQLNEAMQVSTDSHF
jgi:hypothetical protein